MTAMPLRAYAPLSPPCRLCGDGFEHRQPAGAPDLAACPTCGQPVRRLAVAPVNSPKLSAPLSVSRARQAGFTVLKRTSAGEFEKQ
jgi:putative FmdB family regulatory protein